jgi:hypothetical protein
MRDPTAKGELSFPSWFPACIKADARHLHTRAIATGPAWKVAMIERLVGDDRMKSVWAELSQRQRDEKYQKTDRFEHSATLAPPVDAVTDQQTALRLLFVETIMAANYTFYLLQKSERDAVTEIADFMHTHFGSHKRGLTAILASVALESNITDSKVREWTRPKRTRPKRTRPLG